MIGICALKEGPQGISPSSCHVRTQGGDGHPRQIPDLLLPSSCTSSLRTVRNQCLLFMPSSLWCVVLQRPEQTQAPPLTPFSFILPCWVLGHGETVPNLTVSQPQCFCHVGPDDSVTRPP